MLLYDIIVISYQINLTIKFYCIIKQQIPDFIIRNKSIKIKVILYRYTLHSFVHQEPKEWFMTLFIILFIQNNVKIKYRLNILLNIVVYYFNM